MGGALASGALALGMGRRVASTAAATALQVDDVVEVGMLAVGVVAVTWLGFSCLVAALCLGMRALGASWRTGERAVQRYAPGFVRRTLGLGVAASLAVGLATGAGAAAPPGDVAPVTTTSTADLGWVATRHSAGTAPATAARGPERAASDASARQAATGSPTRSTPAPDDLGWVVSDGERPHTVTAPRPSPPPASSAPAHRADPTTRAPSAAESKAAVPATTAAATAWPWSPLPAPVAPVAPSVDHAPAVAGTQAVAANGTSVVVRTGDSLWSIAQEHLTEEGVDAPSDATIAAAWPAWYAANVDVIGDDPDLVRPGQRLVAPTHSERRGR